MTLTIFLFDEKLEIRQSAAVPKKLNISLFRYDVKYRFNRQLRQIFEPKDRKISADLASDIGYFFFDKKGRKSGLNFDNQSAAVPIFEENH